MQKDAVAAAKEKRLLSSDEKVRQISVANTLEKKRMVEGVEEEAGRARKPQKRRQRRSSKVGDGYFHDPETGTDLLERLGGTMTAGDEATKRVMEADLEFKREHAERQLEHAERQLQIDQQQVKAGVVMAESIAKLAENIVKQGGGDVSAKEKEKKEEEKKKQKIRDQNVEFLLAKIPLKNWPGPNRRLHQKELEEEDEEEEDEEE
jgi:hypothetical protein